jgi:hypothetical protein
MMSGLLRRSAPRNDDLVRIHLRAERPNVIASVAKQSSLDCHVAFGSSQ